MYCIAACLVFIVMFWDGGLCHWVNGSWKLKQHTPFECQGLFTQQDGVTSEKTSVFRYMLLLFLSINLCKFMLDFVCVEINQQMH
jgi:hypothetical protein